MFVGSDNMETSLFPLLLLVCLSKSCQGKHWLRFLTFCQVDEPWDGQYDIEFDGDQLLYVDPVTYQVVPRLPEFTKQWKPDPGLAHDAYVSLGTCRYNIPRAAKGENYPAEATESPTALIFPERKTELGVPNILICFVNNFHPPAVNITWTRNGQQVDQSDVSQTQYYSNSDFSFHITSYLNFTPDEGDIYSCSVDHVGLQEPLGKFWEVEAAQEQQVQQTVLCVCGVILGLMGVAAGLWFVMKANKLSQM